MLGLTLGRLGGRISSLSTELTDGTSTAESAPKYDCRDIRYLYADQVHVCSQIFVISTTG